MTTTTTGRQPIETDESRSHACYWLKCQSCGRMVGVTVIDPANPTHDAKFCADGIRAGFLVERCTVGEVRDGLHGWCDCVRAKRRKSVSPHPQPETDSE